MEASFLKTFFARHIGAALNFGVGFSLAVTPDISGIGKWSVIGYVVLSAFLSIIMYGAMSIVWSALITDEEASEKFAPGSESMMSYYQTTVVAIAASMPAITFWLSVTSSFYLLLQLVAHGWYFLAGLELLGAAIGYGYIQWVKKNLPMLYTRASGVSMPGGE